MIPSESVVIMTVTTLQSRIGFATAGGFGPAFAAREALTRQLSAELAPHGIRIVGLRQQGIPETDSLKEAWEPAGRHRE
jgi:NAD(P)-dependent dehydrogenase (short-subunit alcohol dehydrogenase family)